MLKMSTIDRNALWVDTLNMTKAYGNFVTVGKRQERIIGKQKFGL